MPEKTHNKKKRGEDEEGVVRKGYKREICTESRFKAAKRERGGSERPA